MNSTPRSEGRLSFREWDPERDVEAAFRIYGDPLVTRYLGTGRTIATLEEQRSALRSAVNVGDGTGRWAAMLNGEPIGSGLFKQLPNAEGNGTGDFEIGWHLRQDKWGEGLGTDIGRAVLTYALERVPRVLAIAYPENVASLRIMEKIGMRPVGLTDQYYGVETMAYEYLLSSHRDDATANRQGDPTQ